MKPMMKPRHLAILAALCTLLLTSACGQRGPLKLPDQPKSALVQS